MERRNLGTKSPPIEDVIAGLPPDVMASLVQDMAQAIVAMLLDQSVSESDECDVESSDLRQV